jgi:hypothetical protein
LRAYLPASLRDQIDCPTLRVINASFIDEELAGQESDLLFQVASTHGALPR